MGAIRTSRGLSALAALTAALSVSAATQLAGADAPDFVLRNVSGGNVRLSEYRGQVVMLSFWATWCGDCRAQLEQLASMRARYSDAGVELVTVNLDQTDKQASELAAKQHLQYPVLHDAGGEVGRLYDVNKLPVMVLIDRSGTVRGVFEGYRRDNESKYLAGVQALLRE